MKRFAIFMLFLALSLQMLAQPTVITWQGKLLDNSGNAINQNNVSMNFAMFDASAGGNQLWPASGVVTKTVNVVNGLYSVQLGTGTGDDIAFTAAMFDGHTPWLELKVGTETLPRTEITNVPFALISNHLSAAAWETPGEIGKTTPNSGKFTNLEAEIIKITTGAATGKVLSSDIAGNGSWKTLTSADVGAATASHTHDVATTSANGFMSSADKTKLNGITGTNTGDETAARIGTIIHGTASATPASGDEIAFYQVSGSTIKKVTLANLMALVKSSVAPCNDITINHRASDGVAPVNKIITYDVVETTLFGDTKCAIAQNLGASHQATSNTDLTDASAGWYWEFNRKQGYKYDGATRTPASGWVASYSENSNWISAEDPCTLELGNGWRLPTSSEWSNADANGGWNSFDAPWNSVLKLHAAGLAGEVEVLNRGSEGFYWSSTNYSEDKAYKYVFTNLNNYFGMNWAYKNFGMTIRCVRD